jgi:hypothetical protein
LCGALALLVSGLFDVNLRSSGTTLPMKPSELHGGVMTEQESIDGGRVARLIQPTVSSSMPTNTNRPPMSTS